MFSLMTSRVSLEGKTKLPQIVQDSLTESANVCSQIVKGSKSPEVLNTAIKNFVLQEAAVENSDANLKRMNNLSSHLKIQAESIEKR